MSSLMPRRQRLHLGGGRRRADDDLVRAPVEADRDRSREAVRSVVGEPEERRGVEQVSGTGMPELLVISCGSTGFVSSGASAEWLAGPRPGGLADQVVAF